MIFKQLTDTAQVNLALTTQGKCGDDVVVAATGDTSCKYKSKAIDTNWLVNGPSQICGGGGTG